MNSLIEALQDTADGAFVVDEELRIDFWNAAAERILGFDEGDVVGQFCYQILQGYDEEMRTVCKERCQVAQSALKSQPVADYDISVITNQMDRCWLNMSIIPYKRDGDTGKKMFIHLFRDISHKKDDELFFRRILEVARRYHKLPAESDNRRETHQQIEKLTRQEREVLALLSRGLRTGEIGEALSISRNTVRNHIQHILQKLHVHSRLEAVTYAIKNNLLDNN